MIRRIAAELLAIIVAFLFTIFAAGIVAATVSNVFWPVFVLVGCLALYILRPWMRDVLNVSDEGKHHPITR